MSYYSGRIDIRATAIEPLHHGGGTAGNSQVLRRQDIIDASGNRVRVPFISGNSIKHGIRDGAVRYALDVMGVEDGTLTKAVVDVLFSGGHLSKSSSSVSLDRARRLARLFPALSLCGYSAGNEMIGSKLRCSHLHLACEENRWRAPAAFVAETAHFALAGGRFTGDEFGTRHEAARLPHVSRLLLPEAIEARSAAKSKAKGATGATEKAEGSSQMIYDFEVVLPGSRWYGDISYSDVTSGELDALTSSLSYACQGRGPSGGYLFRVAAKSSIGFGLMEWRLDGAVRTVAVPRFEPDSTMLPAVADDDRLSGYAAHLREHREEILAVLGEIGA